MKKKRQSFIDLITTLLPEHFNYISHLFGKYNTREIQYIEHQMAVANRVRRETISRPYSPIAPTVGQGARKSLQNIQAAQVDGDMTSWIPT